MGRGCCLFVVKTNKAVIEEVIGVIAEIMVFVPEGIGRAIGIGVGRG